eukprot:TRINITY_DN71_c0_g1_i1.p1 TRINITY_DN71_c0_g1~~TRINITY_DN71_c0_g1_i1.p1  ORF type:complete len:1244 (+),score=308.24 TRINITY_DN71_c0_g1_i1:83-3814(+)
MNKLLVCLLMGLVTFTNAQQNCTSLTCVPPETCVVMQGQERCMMMNNTSGGGNPGGPKDCSNMTCPSGTMCDMQMGYAYCRPDNTNQTNCSLTCPYPEKCVVMQGQEQCVMMNNTGGNPGGPKDCSNMTCPSGTMCDMQMGYAYCRPDNTNQTNCSLTCPYPEKCVVMQGQEQCVMMNNTGGNPGGPKDCSNMTCPSGTMCDMQMGYPNCRPDNMNQTNCSLACPHPEKCVVLQGREQCVMMNNTGNPKDCSNMTCPSGTMCDMQMGYPNCRPDNMTQDCSKMKCQPGTMCVMDLGIATCKPMVADCSNTTCQPGLACVMENGIPSCKPPNMDCANMTCSPDEKCTVTMGMPMCVPKNMTDCGGMKCQNGMKCGMLMGVATCLPMTCSPTEPCPSGQTCTTVQQMSVCVPNNVTVNCSLLNCPSMGMRCETGAAGPMCVELTCATMPCGGFMKCETQNGKPMCVPAVKASCDTLQCGSGMTCTMSPNGPMCEPSKSGMCGGVGGMACPDNFKCEVPACSGTSDCLGVCVPKTLDEGEVCMSKTTMMDNSYLCKIGTSCREVASSGRFTCQATTEARCTVDTCASTQRCVFENNLPKCIDIQKDPCDMCKTNEICSIDKIAGTVKCEALNACQELRRLQGKEPCDSDSLCKINGNAATCSNGQQPTEDKCAGKAVSSPDSTVAYCSSSGRCPPGFACTGCASNCKCDIFTGNEICSKVMCRPTCELSPVAIPCMDLVSRNMSKEERDYCCKEENIGCEVYDCMQSSPMNSASQKAFCGLFPSGRWCGNTTTGWDCLSEPSMWSFAQRKYCCESEGFGCPVSPYDCSVDAGSVNFVNEDGLTIAIEDTANWPAEHKAHCCELSQTGCEKPVDVNCSNPENSPIWSKSKRQACCSKNNTGCEPKKEKSDADIELLKKCQMATISEEQRKKCCDIGLRCSAAVHNCYEGTSWNDTKKDWCCTRENSGCPFDCTMKTTDTTQSLKCCESKGLQCTAAQQPKRQRTEKPAGKKGFKLAFKGSKDQIELNPKQFLRGIRKAIIATSKALLENPKALRISFVGWLKAGTNSFPSEEEIDDWGFPVPDPWNDENTEEESALKDIVGLPTGTSRRVTILGTVQTVGEEGVFIEATTDSDIVTDINAAVTAKDPTLTSNADGNKYIIEPVGDELVVDGESGSLPGEENGDGDDDDSKLWIIPVVLSAAAVCIGGIAFVLYKKKEAEEPTDVGLGNFSDFTREHELKQEMVDGSI